jgi:hypothetical protein
VVQPDLLQDRRDASVGVPHNNLDVAGLHASGRTQARTMVVLASYRMRL